MKQSRARENPQRQCGRGTKSLTAITPYDDEKLERTHNDVAL